MTTRKAPGPADERPEVSRSPVLGSRTDLVLMADGRTLPALGLGTHELEGAACERAVAEALGLGYRHVDTAEGYGNEREIGRAIGTFARESLFITSKVSPDHLERPALRRACEGSLRRLGTGYLDLYLVHWPNSAVPLEETILALLELRAQGKIRSWGVSNFTMSHLERAGRLELPALNQVEIHPYFKQTPLVRNCEALGVALTAYSPLARGRIMDDPVIREIAEARGATPAQIVLAWLLGRRHVVIPKASTRAHLEENRGALEVALTAADVDRLEHRPQEPRLFDFPWAEFDR